MQVKLLDLLFVLPQRLSFGIFKFNVYHRLNKSDNRINAQYSGRERAGWQPFLLDTLLKNVW